MKITIDTEQDSVHLNHVIEFLTALANKAPKSVIQESPELNAEPSLFNLFNDEKTKEDNQDYNSETQDKEIQDKDDFNLQYY